MSESRQPKRVVSIGASDEMIATPPGAMAAAAAVNHQSDRKRKQDELESNISTTTSSLDLTDNEEMNSILEKRLWSDDCDDVTDAMDSLKQLVGANNNNNKDENRLAAFHCGAPIIIAKAMKRHAACPEIQLNGCFALTNIVLCKLDDALTRQVMLNMGGLKACLMALERHPDHPGTNAYGCHFIGNLWWYPEGIIRQTVVDKGGLVAVLRAMKNHKHDGLVQSFGIFALSTLIHNESAWAADAVVDVGAIEAVIVAMESNLNHASVQKRGCQFLSTIAPQHVNYRQQILQAKGLVAAGEARRIHEGNAEVVDAARKAFRAIDP